MSSVLEKQSVFTMCIYSLFTLGLYAPYWLSKRADALNYLNSKTKINKRNIHILFILNIINIIFYILILLSLSSLSLIIYLGLIRYLVYGIIAILYLIISLQIRRILEDHTNKTVSLLFTLLFSIYYLQYKINKFIDMYQQGYANQNMRYAQY